MWEAWERQDSFVNGWVQKHFFFHSANSFSHFISLTWRSRSSDGADLVPSIASRFSREFYASPSITRGLDSGRYLCLCATSKSPDSKFLILTPVSRPHGSEMLLSKVPYFLLEVEELLTTCDLENILFNLPLDEERYQKTLQVSSQPRILQSPTDLI